MGFYSRRSLNCFHCMDFHLRQTEDLSRRRSTDKSTGYWHRSVIRKEFSGRLEQDDERERVGAVANGTPTG